MRSHIMGLTISSSVQPASVSVAFCLAHDPRLIFDRTGGLVANTRHDTREKYEVSRTNGLCQR